MQLNLTINTSSDIPRDRWLLIFTAIYSKKLAPSQLLTIGTFLSTRNTKKVQLYLFMRANQIISKDESTAHISITSFHDEKTN